MTKQPIHAAYGAVRFVLYTGLLLLFLTACTPATSDSTSPLLQSPLHSSIGTPDIAATSANFATATDAPDLLHQALQTLAAESTATTAALPPTVTPGPLAGPQVVLNTTHCFKLQLPGGWYASLSPGDSSIANYNFYHDDGPPDGVRVHIGVGLFPPEQSFEDWVMERRKLETSPEQGAYGVTLSETEPYTLGRLTGVSYIANGVNPVRVIYLLTDDKRIVGINVKSLSAPQQVLAEAMAMLNTFDISPVPPTLPTPTDPAVVDNPAIPIRFKSLPEWGAWFRGEETTLQKYKSGFQSPEDLTIHIAVKPLPENQTFDQWLTARRQESSSPTNGGRSVTLTAMQPYTLGRFHGYSYNIVDNGSPHMMAKAIHLLTGDRRIVTIDMRWSNTPDAVLSEAMTILHSLEVRPKPHPPCEMPESLP